MEKSELRKVMKRKRSSLSAERILLYSGCIAEHLVERREYTDASVVLAYMSFSSEVNTHFLIEKAWRDGKRVAVPKCVDEKSMEFEYIRSFDDLAPGRYGIMEPVTGESVNYDAEEKCLLLLPGVAYTNSGDRLGYGGGYYDRYQKKHEQIPRVMLAYSLQETESLPVDEQDVPADIIVTEIGCIDTGKERLA
ncbi:MAG: 5-formyltetrahydrofolate cyclo-ligase [Lachnospiraceae bacterium]|nr:5-formyltetrahydrofolate cyclo-ligase [Lachnospiraceae bacterium]MBQ2030943.1 5-formyltetrahydrofolate cyclo-ligase [Lachnospiraceae bacterium]MBQ2558867.1 5-formyltetrahydrofolate cyclo-ligase [Lachnospiraceae bacterium]MCR5375432.1 5-formyltetrahydrofolate cyclo-ligase [Lachnospiraceae bacterium]